MLIFLLVGFGELAVDSCSDNLDTRNTNSWTCRLAFHNPMRAGASGVGGEHTAASCLAGDGQAMAAAKAAGLLPGGWCLFACMSLSTPEAVAHISKRKQ